MLIHCVIVIQEQDNRIDPASTISTCECICRCIIYVTPYHEVLVSAQSYYTCCVLYRR